MESRLDLLSPHLVKKLSQVDEQKLRRIALTACEIALSRIDLKSPLINRTKEALEDSISNNGSSLRVELKSFIDQLDDIQWALKEQVGSGRESMQNYIKAFCNARTFNALFYAIDDFPARSLN
jgi:hypothetical protein